MALSISHVDEVFSSTNTNAPTFSGVNFGAAGANRWVLVCCTKRSTTSLASVTIGGVAAKVDNSLSNVAFAWALVPTGTSGNVSLNFSGGDTNVRHSLSVYRILTADGGHIEKFASVGDTSYPPSQSLEIPTGGVGVGFSYRNSTSGSTTYSWNNLNEDLDTWGLDGNNRTTYSSASSSTAGTATRSATTGAGDFTGAGFISFREASGPFVADSTTGSFNSGNGGSISLAGLNIQEDDYLLVATFITQDVASGGIDANITTSGYTKTAAQTQTMGGSNEAIDAMVGHKKQGVSPDPSVAIAGSGDTSDAASAIVLVVRNADPDTFLDVAIQWAGSSGVAQPNSPQVTTANDNALVVTFGCTGGAIGSAVPAPPQGYTYEASRYQSETNDILVAAATGIKETAGAENPAAWSGFSTQGSGDGGAFAATVAIRPALAGVTATAAQTLTLGQTASGKVKAKATASQPLLLGQSASGKVKVRATAAQSLALGQEAFGGEPRVFDPDRVNPLGRGALGTVPLSPRPPGRGGTVLDQAVTANLSARAPRGTLDAGRSMDAAGNLSVARAGAAAFAATAHLAAAAAVMRGVFYRFAASAMRAALGVMRAMPVGVVTPLSAAPSALPVPGKRLAANARGSAAFGARPIAFALTPAATATSQALKAVAARVPDMLLKASGAIVRGVAKPVTRAARASAGAAYGVGKGIFATLTVAAGPLRFPRIAIAGLVGASASIARRLPRAVRAGASAGASKTLALPLAIAARVAASTSLLAGAVKEAVRHAAAIVTGAAGGLGLLRSGAGRSGVSGAVRKDSSLRGGEGRAGVTNNTRAESEVE